MSQFLGVLRGDRHIIEIAKKNLPLCRCYAHDGRAGLICSKGIFDCSFMDRLYRSKRAAHGKFGYKSGCRDFINGRNMALLNGFFLICPLCQASVSTERIVPLVRFPKENC